MKHMSFVFISARKNEKDQFLFGYLQTDDNLKPLNDGILSFEKDGQKIHDLLTDPETGIIAWEGYNDCRLLLDEFKKRDFEPFDFQLFDVRYMLNVIEEDDDEYVLESFVPLSLQKKETHPYPLNQCYYTYYALKNMLYSIGDSFETFLNRREFDACYYYSLDAYYGLNPKEFCDQEKAVKELLEKDIQRYVFFDFECANCFNKIGKICEIGAVITDTSFNILKEIHHPINPNSEFHLLSKDDVYGLHLFWEANNYLAYRTAPSLKYFYDEFKTLLTDEHSLYIGHSVDNDISFLYTDFERNGLEEFPVHALDTQRMYRKLFDETGRKSISLENAVVTLLGKDELGKYTPHKSLDDAKMTLAVFRAILEQSTMTPMEIVKAFPSCLRCTEEIDFSFRRKKAEYKFPLPRNYGYVVLASPDDLFCGYRASNISERLYLETCCEDFEKSKIASFKGKRYSFQNFYKKRESKDVETMILTIKKSGGILVKNLAQADIIVCETLSEINNAHGKKRISLNDLLSGNI